MREPFTKEQFWAELDALGEEDVLVRFRVSKQWGTAGSKYELAMIWLAEQDAKRALAASEKRDAREERTLAIAAEALSTAKEANRIASEDLEAARSSASSAFEEARWARWAAIIATAAAAIAAKDQILALIFGSS
jgi:hypothetical protein